MQLPLRRFLELQGELQDHIRVNSERLTLAEIKEYPAAVGETIKEDVLALEDELHEALAHVGWKSWARERGIIDREAYVRETIDAFHFLLNLWNIADVTADEISEMYVEKHARNWARYATGDYSMVDGKCAGCGDDFGDIAARQGTPGLHRPLSAFTENGKVYCTERCSIENG